MLTSSISGRDQGSNAMPLRSSEGDRNHFTNPAPTFTFPNETTISQDDAERIWTETYTADAFLEEDEKIRALPRNPDDDDNVEYAVAPILLWSDSTHLANFGPKSLWPIYCFFANVSKYLRCKPSIFSAHHLAYIPSVRLTKLKSNCLLNIRRE